MPKGLGLRFRVHSFYFYYSTPLHHAIFAPMRPPTEPRSENVPSTYAALPPRRGGRNRTGRGCLTGLTVIAGEDLVIAVPLNDHNKPEPWPITMIPGSTPPNQNTENPKFMVTESARGFLGRNHAGGV